MQRETFYHKLRLIFAYYASQGHKQQPMTIREKNFERFLVQSTLWERLGERQQINSLGSSPKDQLRKKAQNRKHLQVLVNSCHKPLSFDEFVNTLAKVIPQPTSNNFQLQQVEEDQHKQKDLFDICQKDKILLNIFTFLYEQIEQSTQFGKVVLFSQQKEHFNQDLFDFMMKNLQLLKTIYFHYFPQAEKNETNGLYKIMNVLRKAFHQFEITPQKLSLTEIFVLFWQIVETKSQSVYEKEFQRLLQTKEQQIQQKQWRMFRFINFIKMIILCANLLALKNNGGMEFEFRSENMIDFLETISISKGYKVIKSTYKVNQCFFQPPTRMQSSYEKGSIQGKKVQNQQLQQLKFVIKPFQSQQGLTSQILIKLKKLIQLIFHSYTIGKERTNSIMPKKQFYFFCRQFKLIPQLISKREMDDMYMKVIEMREFCFVPQQGAINQRQTVSGLITLPQYGLQFQQFQQILIYASQKSESISSKLTSEERLIYWLEHIFSQQRFKALLEKEVNQNRLTITKIDCSNPKQLMQKFLIDNQEMLTHFERTHKLMYQKLKKMYKK